jgi:membrane protein YqaA with SNARE-associated domain
VAYLLAFAIVAAMTATPLPLPSSWLVLAYLSVQLDAQPAAVVVAGALGAVAGRTCLVLWTRTLGPRLMPHGARENVAYLSQELRGQGTMLGVAALLAVSPPPSGALYTAAGLLRVHLALVAAACFAGRLVMFGLGVGLATVAADELTERLRGGAAPWAIGFGLASLAATLWLIGAIDWRALIERRRLRLRRRRPRAPTD